MVLYVLHAFSTEDCEFLTYVILGDPVTKDNILAAIRGRDVPGTPVVITTKSSDHSVKNVVLLRQLRSTAFDRRDLLLLLGMHHCSIL